jgi:hypothetical protein
MDLRWTAGDPERIRAYAAELVGMTPDAILCSSSANDRVAADDPQHKGRLRTGL